MEQENISLIIDFDDTLVDVNAAKVILENYDKEFYSEKSNLYKKKLHSLPIKWQKILNYNYSSYHLFVIRFDLSKIKLNYKKIFQKFRSRNFFVNLHYMPLHLSPFFKKRGFRQGQFPEAEKYAASSISIPIFVDLQEKKINEICNLIKSFF